MNKHAYIFAILLLSTSNIMMPLVNRGYYELDRLFGFPVETADVGCPGYRSRCDRPRCYRSECRPRIFRCNRDNCRWPRIFHVLDRYRIDPNTYYFKTAEREMLLDYAAREGNIRAMRVLLDKYRMNVTDNTLIEAIANNQRRALRFLLDSGATPVDALHYAYDKNIRWAMDMFADYGFRV